MPEQEKKTTRLQMRKIENHQAETLTGDTADYILQEKVRRESAVAAADVLGDVHKVREKVKRPHAFWGYLTFLIAAGILIGLQYMMKERPDLSRMYELARIGVSTIGATLLLIVAFRDSTIQGLLCLFVLPYAIYYAVVRLESYWIRGVFIGVLIALGTELYFMPSQAIVTRAQQQTVVFIENVGGLINKASASPDML
jgi:hypothetical protein